MVLPYVVFSSIISGSTNSLTHLFIVPSQRENRLERLLNAQEAKGRNMSQQPVKVYPNHQYVTGEQHQPGAFLPDTIYAAALIMERVCPTL
jgi:hypothetical protein